jgi:membrane protein involved in D-alanine export
VLLLTPLEQARARRLLLAALNLGFIWLLFARAARSTDDPFALKVGTLGLIWQPILHGLFPILAGLAMFYILLQIAGTTSAWTAAVATMFAASGLIFVIHKLPWTAVALHMGGISPILRAVGYSYVFLRLIDVMRATWERRTPPPNPIDLVNYLLPFHMLAAGPIQAWDEFVAQPHVPEALTLHQSLTMIDRIVRGLFKKYVLAYAIDAIFITHGRIGGWYRLVEMNASYVWLYLDFSAYSDIAIGVGGLLGVATPENFDKPYIARNITDFWERWHISLSMWIRRNLFFPIQIFLMRRTEGAHALWCASIAIFVSFVLCGVWHGLTLPFLAWGLANALGLIVCNLYRHWLKNRLGTKGVHRYLSAWPIRILAIVLTFEFVAFTILLISAASASIGSQTSNAMGVR